MMTRDLVVDAVLDRNLKNILQELGLLSALEAKELVCPECGKLITFDNIGLLEFAEEKALLICDDHFISKD